MNRHEYRVQIVFALYQHLLLKKDLNEIIDDSFNENKNDFVDTIQKDLNLNISSYIEEISKHLNKWSFDRLSYIDQAILLESYSEVKTALNNKNIVIDEAIRIAKEYSDQDSYKYINGVLDNL